VGRASILLPICLLIALPAMPQARRVRTSTSPQGQIDSSEPLFVVMTAINAGGYDQGADSPTNNPLRKQIRDVLKAQDLKSVDAIRRFVRDRKPKNPAAELNQYISYALCLEGPPDFAFRYPSTALPPDVAALEEFTPLLIQFYREAHLDELWKKVQPAYDQAIADAQPAIARAVLQVNAYLRNDTAGYLGRRFQIYIDLLGAPNQVQMRSYVDDFFVVVTPAAELPIEEIRHGYLHYIADPLPLKYSTAVDAKHALGDYALGSPILEEQYRGDFGLLTTECFIKAVESRLDRKPAEVEEALREGFVLTPAIAEQLEVYETQEQAMRLYFPDLINGIDLKREEARLDHIDFLSAAPARRLRTVTHEEKPPELTGAAKTLDQAEKAYADRDLARARDTYLQVLKQTSEPPMHAKAYYGLARIAVLQRDPELGDKLFRKVLELQPDPVTKSWSLLYLGRLADSQGDREQAQEHYKAVLTVDGAPDSVRQSAEKGLKEAFSKKQN